MSESKSIQLLLSEIQYALKVPKKQVNAFGKYKFRSCDDILEAVKPLIATCNLCLTLEDDIILVGDRYYVKSIAKITSSKDSVGITVQAFAREDHDIKGMAQAQITGSASSYARKYALNGLFAIDDTEDADKTNDGGEELSPGIIARMRLDGLRKEMKKLLKAVGKLNQVTLDAIENMSEEQLVEKIAQYEKGETN